MSSDGSFTGMASSEAISAQVSERFKRQWSAEACPDLGSVLGAIPQALRGDVVRTLVLLDIDLLRSAGQSPTCEQMLRRFPAHQSLVSRIWKQLSETCVVGGDHTQSETIVTATRYRYLKRFQAGGMAELLLAQDEDLRRETVVKRLRKPFRDNPAYTAQLAVEAEITGRLDHPGIVPVYGIGQDWEGQPFYVMRRIRGRQLQDVIDEYHAAGGLRNQSRESRQRLFTLLEHLISACNTLAFAHDAGIIHCDVKPANIMVGRYGETFVVDWGLARAFARSTVFRKSMETAVTPEEPTDRPYTRGFTPGYVSPEQYAGQSELQPASDIYSLGATLYQIVTNRTPLSGSESDFTGRLLGGSIVPPRQLCPAIPRPLEAICLKAMHLSPGIRHCTAKELARDLQNWMHDEEVESAPDGPVGRILRWTRHHRLLFATTMLTSVILLVAAIVIGATLNHARLEQSMRLKTESRFEAALDTFEQLTEPLANEERNTLEVFTGLAENIVEFANEFLNEPDIERFSVSHRARVWELRASAHLVLKPDKQSLLDDLSQAAQAYQSAILGSTEDGELRWRLACNYLLQGRVLLRYGDSEPAEKRLDEALDMLTTLRSSPDANTSSTLLARREAEAHHALGELFLERASATGEERDYSRSEGHFVRSRTLREELLAQPIDLTRYEEELLKRDLARSHGYLGDLYLVRGEVSRAEEEYRQSLRLRDTILVSKPGDPEHQFQLARGLGNFSMLERVQCVDRERALGYLMQARDIQQRLVDDFPGNTDFSMDLAWTLQNLAEVHLFLAADAESDDVRDEQLLKANEIAMEASILYDTMDQNNPRVVRGIALTRVLRAVALLDADPLTAAQKAREGMEYLDTPLTKTSRNQDDFFTLALAHACLGHKEDSLQAFGAAVQKGSNTVERFGAHARLGLRSLADDPQYQPQLEKWIAKAQRRVAGL